MIAPNDIVERRNEIKHFVATAKLEQALKRCIDFFRDFNQEDDDDAILISTAYYLVLNEEKSGLITPDEAITKKQQVARRILQTIKDIQIDGRL